MTTISPRAAAPLPPYRSGWSLDRAYYYDQAIFDREVEAIFAKGWQFVGHDCEIPQAGDWFTHQIGNDSAIIVRGRDGRIRGFHNVCRHRGSRLCSAERGKDRAFVCPYHAWAYDLTGKLLRDTMGEHGVPSTELGLRPVALSQVGGLIFLSLADNPPDFAPVEALLGPALKPQGLGRAKVAKIVDYRVQANWKIVWENNRECFHCPTTHPEYIKANYDIQLDDARHEAEIAARTQECAAVWAAKGLEVPSLKSDMTGAWYRANRTPLRPGWVSETLDGRQAAPLMGDYPDPEVGTLRVTMFPSLWLHGSCDHAMSTRVTPLGPKETAVRVYWLVAGHAREDVDFKLSDIMPFWQRTSEQDWVICEAVQQGVQSRGYVPGPFAKVKERNVAHFLDWYQGELRA